MTTAERSAGPDDTAHQARSAIRAQSAGQRQATKTVQQERSCFPKLPLQPLCERPPGKMEVAGREEVALAWGGGRW